MLAELCNISESDLLAVCVAIQSVCIALIVKSGYKLMNEVRSLLFFVQRVMTMIEDERENAGQSRETIKNP